MHRLASCCLAFGVGCHTTSSPPEPVATPTPQAAPVADPEPDPKHEPEPEPMPQPDVAPQPVQQPDPQPKPRADFSPDGLVAAKTWPFYAWDNARAYAYNLRPYGPGSALRVYDDEHGWNDTIVIDRELTEGQARDAVAMLSRTRGEMHVSKCPYPRHAVVLFAGDVPVGSINVCFECGDILIWPPYERSPDWPRKKDKLYKKLMPAYDRVFPQWKRFFEDLLGIPTDWHEIEAP